MCWRWQSIVQTSHEFPSSKLQQNTSISSTSWLRLRMKNLSTICLHIQCHIHHNPKVQLILLNPEPSSKIGTVMKIRQWNQHSSSHTGTSKKVGYMWHHKQMQLETTHGSLHRPRVLAPLASNAHFSPLSPSAERSQNAYGDYLWTNGHPNHHHACHVPQSQDVPRPTLKLRKNDSCPGTSTSILNFA